MTRVEIVGLLVASIHAYDARPQDGPRTDPTHGACDRVEVRAGHGLVGDRYAGQPAHRQAAVTVLDADALDALAEELDAGPLDPQRTRRNIVLRGFPIDELAAPRSGVGALFSLDSGDGPVRFQAYRPAHPCRWMDVVLAPGAFRGMRGRGGVRCSPLDDGVLRLGPALLRILEPSRPSASSASSDPRA